MCGMGNWGEGVTAQEGERERERAREGEREGETDRQTEKDSGYWKERDRQTDRQTRPAIILRNGWTCRVVRVLPHTKVCEYSLYKTLLMMNQ